MTVRHFDAISKLAAQKQGGPKALAKLLEETHPLSVSEISTTPDDRILAAMTRRVFYAGFSQKVIDGKWAAFESAFAGFNPKGCAWMSEGRFDELLKEKDIVRNAQKIRSVQQNGLFVTELADEHGSAARFFSKWPDSDYVGLLEVLKNRGSRLGGETGMRFVRSIGKPAFIPTSDVVKALIRERVLSKAPSGKRDLATMQTAFNQWSAESGLDLTSLSRTLALSVG